MKTALVLWIATVLAGFASLTAFAARPAQTAAASKQWPSGTILKRAENKPTLVLFVHPRCGCSRATLSQLEQMLPRIQNKAQIIVDVYYPGNQREEWAHTPFIAAAQGLPGVQFHYDKDGREATLFNARASGETMFFSQDGQRKFQGGLTPLRGHVGDSIGEQAILDLAEGRTPQVDGSKVFGCQLKEDLSPSAEVAVAQ